MKQSLDKKFTVKVLWIISGIFIPNDSNRCFSEILIDCCNAYPPFPTSTNPHVSIRTVCAKSAQPVTSLNAASDTEALWKLTDDC